MVSEAVQSQGVIVTMLKEMVTVPQPLHKCCQLHIIKTNLTNYERFLCNDLREVAFTVYRFYNTTSQCQ